jgi:L-glutamine:2-deoxy-scyllo-inosose/3-amino-2,3-dideoxy-scyllo-inosose aminotransferase
MEPLAIAGGRPVRDQREWALWPHCDAGTETAVLTALRSARWTVSWPAGDGPSTERRFAREFADYHGVPYAVSVDHGSSALVIALEALDIGPGDEVVVPVMTWVATASTVLRVGALPVLADVDPETGCLTAGTISAAIGDRTRAVVVVHLACTVADLDAIRAVTAEAGLPLIEDCAQAHGARWRGRLVGTFGALGTFSFQQGKVLAAGEGGAVVTCDQRLFRRLQQLRADARMYAPDHRPGAMEIVEVGEVTGGNYCMSELHAAILRDQLPRLDLQHDHREKRAQELERALAQLGGFRAIPVPDGCDRRSIYEFGIRFEPGTFGATPGAQVGRALSAELRRPVYPPDVPLHRSILFRPETKRRFAAAWDAGGRDRAVGRDYPGAEQYHATTLLLHHSALLGRSDDVADIVAALDKVRRHRDRLRTIEA